MSSGAGAPMSGLMWVMRLGVAGDGSGRVSLPGVSRFGCEWMAGIVMGPSSNNCRNIKFNAKEWHSGRTHLIVDISGVAGGILLLNVAPLLSFRIYVR